MSFIVLHVKQVPLHPAKLLQQENVKIFFDILKEEMSFKEDVSLNCLLSKTLLSNVFERKKTCFIVS